VEEDVAGRPLRLEPAHGVAGAREHRGGFLRERVRLVEIRAHEVVGLEAEARLEEARLVPRAAAKLERARVDALDAVGAVALGRDQPSGEQELQA